MRNGKGDGMRLIDADALWKKMQTQYTDGSTDDEDRYYVGINVGITKCHNLVMDAPTIEIPHADDWEKYSERLWKRAYERGKADRPQGYWTKTDVATYRCSECGKIQIADDVNELNFCCCCGSRNKMRRLKGADDE